MTIPLPGRIRVTPGNGKDEKLVVESLRVGFPMCWFSGDGEVLAR